ncbi:helix-turn-helix domain-containing protein [Faecalibacter rhinopitheci]|uniref:AraC family transcriptional regulator n=1 Tax=Faecalibacter rhinopitheci TaxID=2779678 RepID=A0A8J7K3F9_9FLAO|nr:AraC family transcriptional regulator [Faecalibacter rhinopitheci]MBF0596119.1 AraC family transcriptional regulator [Faecalibacter rhinopitheci]MBQ0148912.1 AraC family transcriptional regulator [Candidatus Onthonaster equi]
MKDIILQYSIRDLIDQGPKNLSHKKVTMFDLKAKSHSRYLSKETAYKFSSLGIIHIYKGTCDITVNLEKKLIKQDDILVVLPGQIFEIIQYTDDFEVKAVFVDSQMIVEAGYHIKSQNLIEFLSPQYPKIINLDRKTARDVKYNFLKIYMYIFKNDNVFSEELVIHHLSILMYELGNFYHHMVNLSEGHMPNRKEELGKQFILLVGTHFRESREVQFYADKLFVSRKHLTKVITEVLKKTPKTIISEAVVLEAKVLLKNPNFTISEVANLLNFIDLSIFNKFFKKMTGYNPTDYKNM